MEKVFCGNLEVVSTSFHLFVKPKAAYQDSSDAKTDLNVSDPLSFVMDSWTALTSRMNTIVEVMILIQSLK